MVNDDMKAVLQRYLRVGTTALRWKLDGLSGYDVRRPLVPTGTNLLGLVKHLAGVEAGYLGATFGRPFPEPLPWMDLDAEPNADLWATSEESRQQILDLHDRVMLHGDATIAALDLDAVGQVPWWDGRDVTLQWILVHLTAEVHRHAGHADILREQLDGTIGLRAASPNLPDVDAAWWRAYHDRLERVARQVGEVDA